MEQKFIRAFGYIFTQNTYEQGFRYKLIVKDIVTCTIFCVKGRAEGRDIVTGQSDPDNFAGRLIKAPDYSFKEYDIVTVEPTVVYCYDELLNNNKKLDLTCFDIPEGFQTTFKNDSKFLLCEGTMVINESKFTAPSAIHINSGDKLVFSETRCLGLNIE